MGPLGAHMGPHGAPQGPGGPMAQTTWLIRFQKGLYHFCSSNGLAVAAENRQKGTKNYVFLMSSLSSVEESPGGLYLSSQPRTVNLALVVSILSSCFGQIARMVLILNCPSSGASVYVPHSFSLLSSIS